MPGEDGPTAKARGAFGVPNQATLTPPETALERRCAPAFKGCTKRRTARPSSPAYNVRCALSGLPEPLLLDAAHGAKRPGRIAVCALEGRAVAFGDDSAAIWIPSAGGGGLASGFRRC
jgi:hypothetical protein